MSPLDQQYNNFDNFRESEQALIAAHIFDVLVNGPKLCIAQNGQNSRVIFMNKKLIFTTHIQH